MKTTVKLSSIKSIAVMPITKGAQPAVFVEVDLGTISHGFGMTPDQAGALIFGIEQALEAAGIQRERLAHA